MTLIGAILNRVKSKESMMSKCRSPPPETDPDHLFSKKKKIPYKYAHVRARVDSSAPPFNPIRLGYYLRNWRNRHDRILAENLDLLTAIKSNHFTRGRVDNRWSKPLIASKHYYENRANFLRHVNQENQIIYKRIISSKARVATTAELERDWQRNRRDILYRAQCKFVLFPPVPRQDLEDEAFAPPPGVKRPRVYLTLRIRGAAELGVLEVELFTDMCPQTCGLFTDLLDGDGLGHGYVGTKFYRKVPGLYWSGGDVIYNVGAGCYAQRGRLFPIGAENYHFSHSMPGLLSMHMTKDDEMCGIFNITFKALPQFDLHNVVFARVIRPSLTYDHIKDLGSPLRKQPVVEITATRRRVKNRWVHGEPNTKVVKKTRKQMFGL